MSSWGRLAAALRGAVGGTRALRTTALRRAVGPAVVGSVLGTGLVIYHRCRVSERPASTVFAAEEQVSLPGRCGGAPPVCPGIYGHTYHADFE